MSDAKDVVEERVKTTTIMQTLSLSLGQADHQASLPLQPAYHGYMATISKISRSVNYLPPIKSLTEWFNYAFKSSVLDEVARFPALNPVSTAATASAEKDKDKVQQRMEEIFALPCLRMDLKTRHNQGENVPQQEEPKPNVDCTFVTGK